MDQTILKILLTKFSPQMFQQVNGRIPFPGLLTHLYTGAAAKEKFLRLGKDIKGQLLAIPNPLPLTGSVYTLVCFFLCNSCDLCRSGFSFETEPSVTFQAGCCPSLSCLLQYVGFNTEYFPYCILSYRLFRSYQNGPRPVAADHCSTFCNVTEDRESSTRSLSQSSQAYGSSTQHPSSQPYRRNLSVRNTGAHPRAPFHRWGYGRRRRGARYARWCRLDFSAPSLTFLLLIRSPLSLSLLLRLVSLRYLVFLCLVINYGYRKSFSLSSAGRQLWPDHPT